jgi:hypothetical protein
MLKRILILTTTGMLFLAPVAMAGEDDGGTDGESTPPPTTTTPVPVAPAPPAPPAPAAPKATPHKAKSAPTVTHTSARTTTPVVQTNTVPRGGIQAGAGGSARTGGDAALAGLGSGAAVLLLSAGGLTLRRRTTRG